jgi:hypothetical protein
MPTERVRTLLSGLAQASWALSAVGVAAERRVLGTLGARPSTSAEVAARAGATPGEVEVLLDVLVALELVERMGEGSSAVYRLAADLAPLVQQGGDGVLAADLRLTLATIARLGAAARSPGASLAPHVVDDAGLLRAEGVASYARILALEPFFRAQRELDARLHEPGATLLDVGAGAAGVGLALARLYPRLGVVAVEPSPWALVEARAAVEARGLAGRFELRQLFGQDLRDEGRFALAHVAQAWLPDSVLGPVLVAARRALVPGGWLVAFSEVGDGPDLGSAVSRMRSLASCGVVRSPAQLAAALTAAGFVDVAVSLDDQKGVAPVFARRAAEPLEAEA